MHLARRLFTVLSLSVKNDRLHGEEGKYSILACLLEEGGDDVLEIKRDMDHRRRGEARCYCLDVLVTSRIPSDGRSLLRIAESRVTSSRFQQAKSG